MSGEESELDPPPDLQEWVARYSGYTMIDWMAWDCAVADWHARRLARLQREQQVSPRNK